MYRKDELLAEIKRLLKINVANRDWQKAVIESMINKHNISVDTATGIITQRTDIEDFNEFILFCVAEGCAVKHELDYYFAQTEIDDFSAHVIKDNALTFPFRFMDMIEIVENSQYIGKITSKQLMTFRDAQLINYNENAQRALKRMKSDGGFEIYKIDLNRKAVNSIMDDLHSGVFIPNTITLCISPDIDFSYNKVNKVLTIKEKTLFDLLDGYHRYVALSNESNLDSRFDYPMELRVVVFPESKARHFINQEDKKTKMRKIDSDALAANDPANETCAKIKNKLAGNISVSRNDGMIDESVLSELLRCLCIKSSERYDNKAKNELSDKFVREVLYVQDNCDDIDLKKRWSVPFTVAFAMMTYLKSNDIEFCKRVEDIIISNKMITGKTVNRTVINRIRKEVGV